MFLGRSCLVVTCFLLTLTAASRDFNRRAFLEALQPMRRSSCGDVAGQCFSTAQCCDGLICAAFDDFYGEKPEVPGACVKEKDLQVCQSNADCEGNTRCMAVGRAFELYCIPLAGLGREPPGRHAPQQQHSALGGLGASCEKTHHCRAFTTDGQDELCCKDIRRGRTGTRRLCDRVRSIGSCIGQRF